MDRLLRRRRRRPVGGDGARLRLRRGAGPAPPPGRARAHPVSGPACGGGANGCGPPSRPPPASICATATGRPLDDHRAAPASSPSATRCRRASPCSRPAPERARPTRSPASSPGAWPRVASRRRSCASCRSPRPPPPSCAAASATSSPRPPAHLETGEPSDRRRHRRCCWPTRTNGCVRRERVLTRRWPSSTLPRSPPSTGSAPGSSPPAAAPGVDCHLHRRRLRRRRAGQRPLPRPLRCRLATGRPSPNEGGRGGAASAAHARRRALRARPVPAHAEATSLERADRIDRIVVLVDDIVAEVLRRRAEAAPPHLRQPPRRGPRAARRPPGRDHPSRAAAAVPGGDDRRVPGHRPGAVGHLPHGVPRGPNPATVVVVGDPKQSIYRFRSAELSAYLDARARAGPQVTSLGTNWRSDAALLDALEHLFGGFTFGDPSVVFQPVRAVDPDDRRRPRRPRRPAPRRSSCATSIRSHRRRRPTPRPRHDLVAEVVRLLGEVTHRRPEGRGRPPCAAPPPTSACWCAPTRDATRPSSALALGSGVPAASSSNDSVLDSAAATQWRMLLSALERPSSAPRARAAALTWFVGMTPAELDAARRRGCRRARRPGRAAARVGAAAWRPAASPR